MIIYFTLSLLAKKIGAIKVKFGRNAGNKIANVCYVLNTEDYQQPTIFHRANLRKLQNAICMLV
jgi:hypothetical protein